MSDNNRVYDIIKPFHRRNPLPLDRSSLYTSYIDAENYAENDPSAYLGQVVSVVDGTERVVTIYKVVYSGDTDTKTLARVDDMSFQKILELKEYLETVIDERISEMESGMTELEERVSEIIDSGLTQLDERVTDLEDNVAGIEEELERVVSAVTYNDPLVNIDKVIHDEHITGLTMSEVFGLVADEFDDVNQNISDLAERIDDLPGTTYSKEEIDEYREEVERVICEALNDLNRRIQQNENSISGLTEYVQSGLTDVLETVESEVEKISEILGGEDAFSGTTVEDEIEALKEAIASAGTGTLKDIIVNGENIVSGDTATLDIVPKTDYIIDGVAYSDVSVSMSGNTLTIGVSGISNQAIELN